MCHTGPWSKVLLEFRDQLLELLVISFVFRKLCVVFGHVQP